MESAAPYKFDDRLSYGELIVHTQDSVRHTYTMNLQALFTGGTSTSKTVHVHQHLSTLPNDLISLSVIFSAVTSTHKHVAQARHKRCHMHELQLHDRPAFIELSLSLVLTRPHFELAD